MNPSLESRGTVRRGGGTGSGHRPGARFRGLKTQETPDTPRYRSARRRGGINRRVKSGGTADELRPDSQGGAFFDQGAARRAPGRSAAGNPRKSAPDTDKLIIQDSQYLTEV